jgi:predicted XRE-type DNA-binding protein
MIPKSREPEDKFSYFPNLEEVSKTMQARKKLISKINQRIEKAEIMKLDQREKFMHKQ